MISLRKLERDFVQADLVAVNKLLLRLTDEDVMSRFGLESRREELQKLLEHLDESRQDEPVASAALFFGGTPVIGTRGIESEFAGLAVTKFQDIVAKVLAKQSVGLGQRGIVPNKSASTLHITNIVRGSFGFLLEEVNTQKPLVETSLKMAVEEATGLFHALGEPDEEQFSAAVESTDSRVLETARDFFDLMRQNGATFRLVTAQADRSFNSEAVIRAAERARSTTVEDTEDTVVGQLAGVLPDAHQFEFLARDDGRIIRGKVSRMLDTDQLTRLNREMVNVNAAAKMNVRRVRRNGAVARENFTLLSLEPLGEA